MSEYLSYGQILKDKLEFKRSGTKSGNDLNLFDTPSHKYFKILFYFGDIFESSNIYGMSNGLLHPTWEIFNTRESNTATLGMNDLHYYDYNSAWSYLKLNDENERAEKLEKFVKLLSNINSYSPWYFNSISGLDAAMDRKGPEGNFEMPDEPGKITIKCLPDAFDNRIGTLLELYRDIVWSWSNKKEIIPANLRKFDMAIYIFESNISAWHDDLYKIGEDSDKYITSYKMLEFHDCEFGYNSIKSGWSELNNETGIDPIYSIDISYNDCYEISYNEQMMRKIGDVILTDTYQAILEEKDDINVSKQDLNSKSQEDNVNQSNEFNRKLKYVNTEKYFSDEAYSFGNIEQQNLLGENPREIVNEDKTYNKGFIENAVGQVFGVAKNYVEHKLTRAVLGNLYTYSLTKFGSQFEDVLQGNLIKTGQSVKQYIDNAQQRAAAKVKTYNNLGNLYKNTIANN